MVCSSEQILRLHRLMEIGGQRESVRCLLPAGLSQAVKPGCKGARIESLSCYLLDLIFEVPH